VSAERLRVVMVALLIGAAVTSVLAHKSNQGWVTAISFTLFALGVLAYFQWRRQVRAKVFDREDKTS
jgi:hypothetical protein